MKLRYYWFFFYFLRFYFYPYCLDRHELSCLWPVCGCFGNVGILIGRAECENCLSLCPFFGSDSPRLLLIAINNLAMPLYFYSKYLEVLKCRTTRHLDAVLL